MTMIYDIFELHARCDTTDTHSERTPYIVRQLTDLLATGIGRTERDVSYCVQCLNVSTKNLQFSKKKNCLYSIFIRIFAN